MVVMESSCLLKKKSLGLDFRKARMGRNMTWGNRSDHCPSTGRERPEGKCKR